MNINKQYTWQSADDCRENNPWKEYVRNGKIRADFYGDCQDIPDPSVLDPTQKNLLLLDDCFPGKQNKAEAYYTRVDTTIVTRYTLHYFRLPRHTI